METTQNYDAIVVGSGQAGTPLSRTLAEAGLKTVLIEHKHVGGSCVNEGCTPTKTMVASGRLPAHSMIAISPALSICTLGIIPPSNRCLIVVFQK
jgi:pyruvate/2-oxoglutarate dehydrogenase complex dihydrolipoamide dehydrogenase (E3) component